MSDAYAAAGVDTGQSDRAVSAIVEVLKTIETIYASPHLRPRARRRDHLRCVRLGR